MDFSEYSRYDATGLAELVATKQVTPAELLAAARARAVAVNNKITAIVRTIPEADKQVEGELSGPFAGVPFLIKDLGQDYKGHPTSGGCRALSTLPAPEHSTIVQRWLDAGLVIFGKTNTPEFGSKGITEPELFGASRNPWDLDRTPGGSSGGSAAAVAAGIVPVAGASDGGGSIRIPAGCCGLVGLKPGRGITPMGPAAGEPMHGAAVSGTVSRTVRDTAAMLDVIAGPDATSPYLPAIPEDSYASQVGRDPGKLRIGVRIPTVITPNPDPAAAAAVEAAVRVLTHLGHEVEEVSAPYDDGQLARDFLLTWFVHAAYEVDDTKRQPEPVTKVSNATPYSSPRWAAPPTAPIMLRPWSAGTTMYGNWPPSSATTTCCSRPRLPRSRRRSASSTFRHPWRQCPICCCAPRRPACSSTPTSSTA